MDWDQNDNGNWVAKLDSGEVIAVYPVKDDYGYPQSIYDWMLIKPNGWKIFSGESHETPEDAMRDAEEML